MVGLLLALPILASCGEDDTIRSSADDSADSVSNAPATPPEPPAAVVEAYFAAEDAQDCDGMVETVTKTQRGDDGLLCEQDETVAFECPSGFVEVGETEIDGEFATVGITEVYGCQSGKAPDLNPDDFESTEIKLVIEDGEWRINEFVSEY